MSFMSMSCFSEINLLARDVELVIIDYTNIAGVTKQYSGIDQLDNLHKQIAWQRKNSLTPNLFS